MRMFLQSVQPSCGRPKHRQLQAKLFQLEGIISALAHAHTSATCQAVAGLSTQLQAELFHLEGIISVLAHAHTSATWIPAPEDHALAHKAVKLSSSSQKAFFLIINLCSVEVKVENLSIRTYCIFKRKKVSRSEIKKLSLCSAIN
jgi:hypothetical protein